MRRQSQWPWWGELKVMPFEVLTERRYNVGELLWQDHTQRASIAVAGTLAVLTS